MTILHALATVVLYVVLGAALLLAWAAWVTRNHAPHPTPEQRAPRPGYGRILEGEAVLTRKQVAQAAAPAPMPVIVPGRAAEDTPGCSCVLCATPTRSLDELDACMDRHPAKGDAARLEQMLAIRDAEDAWDRNVWGQK